MYHQYGDIVLLKGTDFKSRVLIDWLTDCRYHHSGLLTDELTMDIMTQRGVISNHLVDDMEEENYDEYLILQHRDMTLRLREKIKQINEEKFRNKKYDNTNINRLVKKLLFRKFVGKELDKEDISDGGLFCHSRMGKMYREAGLALPQEIHTSQLIASHFMEIPFRVVGRGNRLGRSY